MVNIHTSWARGPISPEHMPCPCPFLEYKACHIPVYYRCRIQKSNHIRPLFIEYFSVLCKSSWRPKSRYGNLAMVAMHDRRISRCCWLMVTLLQGQGLSLVFFPLKSKSIRAAHKELVTSWTIPTYSSSIDQVTSFDASNHVRFYRILKELCKSVMYSGMGRFSIRESNTIVCCIEHLNI